jgi:hypothetical protein
MALLDIIKADWLQRAATPFEAFINNLEPINTG